MVIMTMIMKPTIVSRSAYTSSLLAGLAACWLFSTPASAQCSLTPSATPVPADGYSVQVVAQGLQEPRGIQFDSAGNLVVVEQGRGISNIRFTDHGGTCLEEESRVDDVIADTELAAEMNHGLVFSPDGQTMYASSTDAAYAFAYDAEGRTTSPNPPIVVTGMENPNVGHGTRTLHYSNTEGGPYLLASKGSDGNFDLEAGDVTTGHCHIRAFSLSSVPEGGYDYATQGTRMGWGLRNSVGMTEHPDTGEVWSVENSADEITREGTDIHQDNPGEEINRHGTVAGTEGLNYGYPFCLAAWDVDVIPNNAELDVGSQFAVDLEEQQKNDTFCADAAAPRLTLPAHVAPLDIKFNTSTEAFITFHGSWNRDEPAGYRLVRVEFADGEPTADSTSTEAAVDVVTNEDLSVCPDECFRPVGMAFDAQGRLFMSSDATGEIYVVMKNG